MGNFKDYENNERLDTSYSTKLKSETKFKDLYSVIQLILIFSHGNAFVESGFSINKQLLVENLQEKSIIAQRLVYDNILLCGGALEIVISIK